jgi:hypothetical protein
MRCPFKNSVEKFKLQDIQIICLLDELDGNCKIHTSEKKLDGAILDWPPFRNINLVKSHTSFQGISKMHSFIKIGWKMQKL